MPRQLGTIVERCFETIREMHREEIRLPSNSFVRAMGYALSRETALQVFLERAIRPIAVGRTGCSAGRR